ncbi:UDP-N-acetylglucosamine--N-acetylmuramyl-(pentapeptide)pyrophosphoryl-undecaprenolN-acetylglucosaminetransferase [Serratia symbiotica]|nr:UDP-N-acetylglucosamine--N-acetylmuramyl-(pentapeptide)pyrophosphoryl-undecaprenolN-acetylglucosaminetransferase [Serratia symbiotica]
MNKKSTKRLMIMAGGTGGHIFPGIVIAHYLIKKNWNIRWIGTIDRIEADLVPKNGIKISFINISSLRGKKIKHKLYTLFNIYKAIKQAKLIINQFQPNVVLCMGGYVSGPSGLAAWLCGIPIVLHEQNSVAGFTNKCLSYFAKTILQAFPGAFSNAKVVGNPLRDDILSLKTPNERFSGRTGPIRILVMGGSQGAQILNQEVVKIAKYLGNTITLWHQVGQGSLTKILFEYKKIGQKQHKVTEFIDDIASAYTWADIVICRSGALTVSEITAVGLPAIFVPFQHKDRQQYWNALPLEKAGVAKIIEQSKFKANIVCKLLKNWKRPILLDMAKKSYLITKSNSTLHIIKELIQAAK